MAARAAIVVSMPLMLVRCGGEARGTITSSSRDDAAIADGAAGRDAATPRDVRSPRDMGGARDAGVEPRDSRHDPPRKTCDDIGDGPWVETCCGGEYCNGKCRQDAECRCQNFPRGCPSGAVCCRNSCIAAADCLEYFGLQDGGS